VALNRGTYSQDSMPCAKGIAGHAKVSLQMARNTGPSGVIPEGTSVGCTSEPINRDSLLHSFEKRISVSVSVKRQTPQLCKTVMGADRFGKGADVP
jgi:hypothetical protein